MSNAGRGSKRARCGVCRRVVSVVPIGASAGKFYQHGRTPGARTGYTGQDDDCIGSGLTVAESRAVKCDACGSEVEGVHDGACSKTCAHGRLLGARGECVCAPRSTCRCGEILDDFGACAKCDAPHAKDCGCRDCCGERERDAIGHREDMSRIAAMLHGPDVCGDPECGCAHPENPDEQPEPVEPVFSECRFCDASFEGSNERNDCGGCRLTDEQCREYAADLAEKYHGRTTVRS